MKRSVRLLLWGVWGVTLTVWVWWYWFPETTIQVGYVLVTNAGTPHWRLGLCVEAGLLALLLASATAFLRPDWLYGPTYRRHRAPWLWAIAGALPWSVFLSSPWLSIPWRGGLDFASLLPPTLLALLLACHMRIVRTNAVRRRIRASCTSLVVIIASLSALVAFNALPALANHKTFWGKIDQIYRSFRRHEDLMLWPIAVFLTALASRLIIDHLRWTLPPDDQPLCERCGYDLRGSIPAGATHCPECGEVIAAELRKRE